MKQKNRFSLFLLFGSSLLFLQFFSSCTSQQQLKSQYLYFQEGSDTVTIQKRETVIQPNDLLSIQVFSKTLNQEQAAIFNIPTNTNTTAASGSGSNSTTTQASAGQGYQVTTIGTIEMPVIGAVKAAGLTKEQLQAVLVEKITNYVKNPTVIVRFLEFDVNVMGEVRSPGTKKFTTDRVTIIDALNAAGDLTDFGVRDNIMVIREVNGKKYYNSVDLKSKNIFASPMYILQPNDIVYVTPNKHKLQNINADTETQRKIGLYSSFFGIAISIISLVVYLRR